MSAVLKFETQYEITPCCVCGVSFAPTESFIDARRKDNKTFYCPNGHSLCFRENKIDKLNKELERERNRVEMLKREAERAKGELHGARIQLTKMRNKLKRTETRVSKGVCPCCNRTFMNSRLARHIATKHPGYTKD